MKAISVLHRSVIVTGIILAIMGAIVATVLAAPLGLLSSALAAAAKVLGEGIDENKHRALVDRFLKEQLGELA